MDPEIPLRQAKQPNTPPRMGKTLGAAFDPSKKLIRSSSFF